MNFLCHLFVLLILRFVSISVATYPNSSDDGENGDKSILPFGTLQEGDISVLFSNDDNHYRWKLNKTFNFLEESYDTIFVSENGEVTFGREPEPINSELPHCTPRNIPRIMAYWADVLYEVDQSHRVHLQESVDKPLLRKVARDIIKAFPWHYGLVLEHLAIITWKEAPFYGAISEPSCDGTKKRNTFQLVLASNERYSFALVFYSKIEWSTGSASGGNCLGVGGHAAKVGVDIGDGENWHLIPGSCTDAIMNTVWGGNVGEKGKWVMQVGPTLRTGSCEEFKNFKGSRLGLTPNKLGWIGGVPLELEGPCISINYTSVSCTYQDIINVTVEGHVMQHGDSDLRSVVCPTPHFRRLGRMKVILQIEYGLVNETFFGYLLVTDDNSDNEVKINWDFTEDIKNKVDADVQVIEKEINPEGQFESNEVDEEDYVEQVDERNSTIPLNITWNPEIFKIETEITEKIMRAENEKARINGTPLPSPSSPISQSATSNADDVKSNDLELVLEQYNSQKQKWEEIGALPMAIPNTGSFTGSIDKNILEDKAKNFFPDKGDIQPIGGFLRKVGDVVVEGLKGFSRFAAPYVLDFMPFMFGRVPKVANKYCNTWSKLDKLLPPAGEMEPCPPTKALAQADGKFAEWNGWEKRITNQEFRSTVHRQKVPNPTTGAGSHCAYDMWGNLMTGMRGGMGMTRYSPTHDKQNYLTQDLLPYIACCHLGGYGGLMRLAPFLNAWKMNKQCKKYHKRRPGDDGSKYPRPRPARAAGDPHITTFDGLQYTFNGVGEFYLVKMQDSERNSSFQLQARMEQYITPSGRATDASVFTAVAMRQKNLGEEVIIQVNYMNSQWSILLDGETLEELEDVTVIQNGASVSKSEDGIFVTFNSGFAFQFVPAEEDAINIMGSADKKISGLPQGLMGNCDGNSENDLLTPDGVLLTGNMTTQDIHYEFGLPWMVQEEDSLFTYLEGLTYKDYSRPDFKPKFLDESKLTQLPKEIQDSCGNQVECLFDYATTGSQAMSNATKEITIEFQEKVEVFSTEVKVCSTEDLPETPEHTSLYIISSVVNNLTSISEPPLGSADLFLCSCRDASEPYWFCKVREGLLPEVSSTTAATTSPAKSSSSCEPPKIPEGGHIVGDDFSLGATIHYQCNEGYEDVWNNCNLTAHKSLCYKFCNVTYTCVKNEIKFRDGPTQEILTWRAYGEKVRYLPCRYNGAMTRANGWELGKITGHFFTSGRIMIQDEETGRSYIIGCSSSKIF